MFEMISMISGLGRRRGRILVFDANYEGIPSYGVPSIWPLSVVELCNIPTCLSVEYLICLKYINVWNYELVLRNYMPVIFFIFSKLKPIDKADCM